MRTGARLYHAFSREKKPRIRRNLSLIRPDLDPESIRKGSLEVFQTVTRSWTAMLGNGRASSDDFADTCEVEGIEPFLESWRASGRVIVAAGHVGPIDDMFGIIPHYGARVYIPVEAVEPAWLLRFMTRYRAGFGDTLIEPVERGRTLDRAREQLADGRMVVFMIDATKKSGGVLCRVGNAQARFPVGAMRLGLQENASVVPVFSSWGQNGKTRMVFGEPFVLERTGDLRRDTEANTRRFIEEVYAPHFLKHCTSWQRLPYLEPIESDKS